MAQVELPGGEGALAFVSLAARIRSAAPSGKTCIAYTKLTGKVGSGHEVLQKGANCSRQGMIGNFSCLLSTHYVYVVSYFMLYRATTAALLPVLPTEHAGDWRA